jgi:hypothetical protein
MKYISFHCYFYNPNNETLLFLPILFHHVPSIHYKKISILRHFSCDNLNITVAMWIF